MAGSKSHNGVVVSASEPGFDAHPAATRDAYFGPAYATVSGGQDGSGDYIPFQIVDYIVSLDSPWSRDIGSEDYIQYDLN